MCGVPESTRAASVMGGGMRREIARLGVEDGGDGEGVLWSGDGGSVIVMQGFGRVTRSQSEGGDACGRSSSIEVRVGWRMDRDSERGGRRLVVVVGGRGKRSAVSESESGRVVEAVGWTWAVRMRVIGASDVVVTTGGLVGVEAREKDEIGVDAGDECYCLVIVRAGGIIAGRGRCCVD